MIASTGTLSPDGFYALYETSFSPTSPQTHCKATDDDSGPGIAPELTINLQAGFTYVLVTTQCCDGTLSGEEMNYNSDLRNGNVALTSNLAMDVDGNGVVDALTDGLMLLRWQFGLRGAGLITGAVGLAATRSTAPMIEAYLTTLDVSPPPPAVVLTEKVGGTGGNPYVRSCDATSVAVGLIASPGLFEGPNIGGVVIVCAPYLRWSGAAALGVPATNLALVGDTAGGAGSPLSCASGSVITGLQGSTKPVFGGADTVVENLTLQCTPVSPGATVLVGPFGAGNTIPFNLPCPAGTVMRGLEGRADYLLDSMRVRCQ